MSPKRTCEDTDHMKGCVCSPPKRESMTDLDAEDRALLICDYILTCTHPKGIVLGDFILDQIKAAEQEARKTEREACANIADMAHLNHGLYLVDNCDKANLRSIDGFIADAIRSRAEE